MTGFFTDFPFVAFFLSWAIVQGAGWLAKPKENPHA